VAGPTIPFTFEHTARSPAAMIIIGGVWVALAVLWGWLDTAVWIVGFLALFTLPAVWDTWRDTSAGLTLDDNLLRWHAGRREAEVALEEIDHVRLDTRLDFSVRATVLLKTGRKLRLPFESTPPHQAFEDALHARDVKTQRHHFTLMQ